MHGQKKRRKRTSSGEAFLANARFGWELVGEPQLTTEGRKGLRIRVHAFDKTTRELMLDYPFPPKRTGNGSPQVPQRPAITAKLVEDGIRRALAGGWDPDSRGRPYIFAIPSDERTAKVKVAIP